MTDIRIDTGVDGIVATLRPAPRWEVQTFVDCNMASAWVGEQFRVFPGKYGEDPVWGPSRELRRGSGTRVSEAFTSAASELIEVILPPVAPPGTAGLHGAVWFESAYAAPDGRLYVLYHNENYPETLPFDPSDGTGLDDRDWPPGLLGEGSAQAVPRIGVMRSVDGGDSWTDLGIVLEDRDERMIRRPVNGNFCFPGGVGDPSAVVSGDHLYVFFGEYGYPSRFSAEDWDADVEASGQCVSVARLPLADLDAPAGTARRWDGAAFGAPWDGVGRPIAALAIPAEQGGGAVSAGDRRFYWGPSVSWNEDLEVWTMLLGCVDGPFWAGDTVYLSVNTHRDLGDADAAQAWSTPVALLHRPGRVLWYPSLQPTDADVDREHARSAARLGAVARLFVKDFAAEEPLDAPSEPASYDSRYTIEFTREGHA